MSICKNCIHFKKETVVFPTLGSFDTWINFANPDVVGAPSYDIAKCGDNKKKTITRDMSTAYFFEDTKYTNTFGDTTIVGENDSCPNFQPIVP